jgi:hypothetical protein
VIATEKERVMGVAYQRVRRSERGSGEDADPSAVYRRASPYLSPEKSGGSPIKPGAASKLDAAVGFTSSPFSAKLGSASAHLGVASVAAAWAYQGSRSAFAKGRIFTSPGRHVCCVRDADGQVAWEAEVKGARVDLEDQIFLPPALGREHLYFTSVPGHVVSVHQESGAVGLLYDTQRPIAFQPCLAQGRIHFGTAIGELVCLDTGNDDADGWYMWGGNAQHNKIK